MSAYKENILFAALCLSGLLILGILGFKPLYAQNHRLDTKISSLQQRTGEQQQLAALIATVDRRLLNRRHKFLPDFRAAALPMTRAGDILSDVKKIATGADLKVLRITPELGSKKDAWHHLAIKVELHGLFPNLRKFVLDLLTLPYVKDINRMAVRATNQQLVFDLTYTVWLN